MAPLQACALIDDISVTVENPACSKCWTSENLIKALYNCGCPRFELDMCRYGTPNGRPTIVASFVSNLAAHLVGACSCTKPQIPLQGVFVCSSTGNRCVWLSSLASQYPPEFCRKFAREVCAPPHGAQALETLCGDGQQPCWRRPPSKSDQSVSASMPHTLSFGVYRVGQPVKEYEALAATSFDKL